VSNSLLHNFKQKLFTPKHSSHQHYKQVMTVDARDLTRKTSSNVNIFPHEQ